MAKLAAVLAVLLCAATWAIHSETNDAGACTGAGFPYSDIGAPVVFEGWVSEIEPIASEGVEPNHRVSFEVVRGFRGATAGETIDVETYLPVPGRPPLPCGSLTPDRLADRYVVLALPTGDPGAFHPFFTLYIGDVPTMRPDVGSDIAYAEAIRRAELATDANPERPLLTVEPSAARCGEAVTFVGERFPIGSYLLARAWNIPLGRAQVTDGSTSRFEVTVTIPPCFPPDPQTGPWVIEALPELPSTGDIPLGPVIEYAALTITGTLAEPLGEPRLEVAPGVVCGGLASVTGTGFAPGRTYSIRGGNPESKSAVTDASGRFDIDILIPSEHCDTGSFQSVFVLYPGFEDFGPQFQLASAFFGVDSPPGPPNLGNAQPTSDPVPLPWLHVAGLAALILGASLLVARRRSRPD